MLFNNPTNPFDRNGNGDNVDTANCDDPNDTSPTATSAASTASTGASRSPAGDESNGSRPLVAGFITLDQALTNEQRALLGCGPFYASRCDSSLPFRDFSRGLYFGNYGGLDFMNMEASRAGAVVARRRRQSHRAITSTSTGHPARHRRLGAGAEPAGTIAATSPDPSTAASAARSARASWCDSSRRAQAAGLPRRAVADRHAGRPATRWWSSSSRRATCRRSTAA